MIKQVIIPFYMKGGIVHNDIGFPKRLSFWGCDTETVNGEPDCLSICDKNLIPILIRVNRQNVLDKFLDYFSDRILSQQVNICYFHNLEFDLSVLLIKYHDFYVGRSSFKIEYKGHTLFCVIGKINFCNIVFPSKKSLFVLDSMAFIHGSLKNVSEGLKLPQIKLKRPIWIGKKTIFSTKASIEYAKADCLVQYYLADWIIKQYKKYDTRICISASQFSAKIFRHFYMFDYERIKFPNKKIVEASLLSYHGGKNGFYYNYPVIVKSCTELDINSAYPYAMTNLPNMVKGKYAKIKSYRSDLTGVYCITGKVLPCKYPILYDHDFKKIDGDFKNIWVTSYELKEALRMKEVKIKKIWGYVFIEDKNYKHNPLKEFVKDFWKQKETAKDFEQKTLYKLILNSLYGKFIQTTKMEEELLIVGQIPEKVDGIVENKNDYYKAGGLFNPFIATLITGFVRAYLHKMEHDYKAIHSSTDSIKTCMKIKPGRLPQGLGGLKKEIEGRCIILRNKLYIHYGTKDQKPKYALHGFTGNLKNLTDIIESRNTNYTTKRMLKVREAIRQGLKPLVMIDQNRNLDVDIDKIKYI